MVAVVVGRAASQLGGLALCLSLQHQLVLEHRWLLMLVHRWLHAMHLQLVGGLLWVFVVLLPMLAAHLLNL